MLDKGCGAFIPEHYHIDDEVEIRRYIEQQPMCQINSHYDHQLHSTALPLIPCPQHKGHYIGHLAKRNKQTHAISAGSQALAVFSGPEAYISPRWFSQRKTVPTWNYISIQLRGRFECIDTAEGIEEVMQTTVDHMENLLCQNSDHPAWEIPEADPSLYAGLLHGIVAFRFKVDSIEGIKRCNQDKDIRDVESIMAGLKKTKQPQSSAILALMSKQFEVYL